MIFFKEIRIETKKRRELLDLTDLVKSTISSSGITDGLCIVYSKHTTGAIIVNENESGLKQDVIKMIEELFPEGMGWKHNRIDNNADAHLACALIGPTASIPVKDRNLTLGTWQSILFLELDGPRMRSIIIEVLGE